ncbi:Histidine kinase 4 [Platanthera zijinensis]|uniref:Histidine kinase 4 n=1 Tax=Platanthera zijinensis TaxID=2320716 RepID=A0AAP0BG89_9ASPA
MVSILLRLPHVDDVDEITEDDNDRTCHFCGVPDDITSLRRTYLNDVSKLLVDIIGKTLWCRTGSIEFITNDFFNIMAAIVCRKIFPYGLMIFDLIRESIREPKFARIISLMLHEIDPTVFKTSKGTPIHHLKKISLASIHRWELKLKNPKQLAKELTAPAKGFKGMRIFWGVGKYREGMVNFCRAMRSEIPSAGRRWWQTWTAWTLWILLMLVVWTVIHCYNVASTMKTAEEALVSMCDERARMLQDQFAVSVNHVHALAILISTFHYQKNPSAMDQETFAFYTGMTAFERPLLNGVAYAQRVLHSERENFESQQGWTIKTMKQEPSPVQDEYAPVIFSQETVFYLEALDMMSEHHPVHPLEPPSEAQ